jgi:hypothetical protein
MRPEEVFTVLCTSPLGRVGRESRQGKRGPSKCLDSKWGNDPPEGKSGLRGKRSTR